REIEDLEIISEIAGVPAGFEKLRERPELRGGQLHTLLLRQLEHGPGAQAAVEMAVELRLGQPPDGVERESHAWAPPGVRTAAAGTARTSLIPSGHPWKPALRPGP